MLNSFLNSFYLNATIFHRSLVCDAWSTDTSGTGNASFHLITSGVAYLHLKGRPDISTALHRGDMVIFPHDAPHLISYSSDQQLAASTDNFLAFPMGSEIENSTGLVCGFFDFGQDSCHPIIQQLPSYIIVKSCDQQGALTGLTQALVDEAERTSESSEAIMTRLSEVFFLALLRNLATAETNQLQLFRALQDPKMAKIIQAIHMDIAHPGSVETMATTGGYSRASFASHFKRYFDTSPLDYLTQLRLAKAKRQLLQGDSVLKVALEIGYQSEASFAKAYKRHYGCGPGAARLAGE